MSKNRRSDTYNPMSRSSSSSSSSSSMSVNGYGIEVHDFDVDVCPNDDDLNDDGVRSIKKSHDCPPGCPGHPCKYGCGVQLHAKDFPTHKQKCPNIPTRCYASRQCGWHGARSDLKTHAENCKWVLLLPATQANQQLTEKVQDLSKQLFHLTNQVKHLKDKYRGIHMHHDAQISQLAGKVTRLDDVIADLRIAHIKNENAILNSRLRRSKL